MKKIIITSILIFLQGCGSQISTARLLSSPTTTPSIELSYTFPLVWTATPSPFKLAATIPMNTNTPSLSQTNPPKGNFDPSTKTLITFVNDGWIYAADWEGQITPLWNLANDNNINAGDIHMEISPDRKSLAFSGIGNNGDPSLEVLDLSTLIIKDQVTFKGKLITDYAWSSDSHKIVASITTFHNNLEFDTSVVILDLSNILNRNSDLILSNRIISQIEWPLTSNILYTDYSCEADPKVEPPPGDNSKYGISGIGLYDLDSKKTTHRNMVATVEWPGVKFTVSPDTSRILFFSWWPGLTQPGINIMLAMKSLNPIPCSFCGGFSNMIWFSNYILGDFPNYGEFGGTINLIESTNGKIYKISDSGIRPNSNIVSGLGDTVWIDYSEVEGSQIWAADIQSCIGIDEATNECVKPMWSIQGKWPNTYNNLENNNIACPN